MSDGCFACANVMSARVNAKNSFFMPEFYRPMRGLLDGNRELFRLQMKQAGVSLLCKSFGSGNNIVGLYWGPVFTKPVCHNEHLKHAYRRAGAVISFSRRGQKWLPLALLQLAAPRLTGSLQSRRLHVTRNRSIVQ